MIREDELMYVLTREGRERLAHNEAEKVVARFDKDHEGNINIEGKTIICVLFQIETHNYSCKCYVGFLCQNRYYIV